MADSTTPEAPSQAVEGAPNGLHRSLKPRHVQMIAIGGVIGTGLFLGTANELKNGGPAGLLLAFVVMASLLFVVTTSLGEMVSQFPLPGGQLALAGRFCSPELGFAMGWMFWYCKIVVLPAQLAASAVLISYWTPAGHGGSTCTSVICDNAMWIGLMLLVVWAVNFAGTRVFGEIEFWFCSIKVTAIIGMVIAGIIITSGGGPDHQSIGFRYWRETGGFVQFLGIAGAKGRFLGFFSVLINAAFAFIGTEMTAIAAAETARPRETVPRAIRSIWIRLILFYVSSVFMIGLLVSPTDPSLNLSSTAAKSPFVIAIQHAGITILPSIINAAILTSAWSAACVELYISSRTLYGLASRGQAPSIFLKTRKDGLPWVCVLVGMALSLLSFMSASQGKPGIVFRYFADMASMGGIISWTGILVTAVRWNKGLQAQGIDRRSLAYRAPLQPYLCYCKFPPHLSSAHLLIDRSSDGLAICAIILIFGGFTAFVPRFNASVFITTYCPIPFFLAMLIGYKIVTKSRIVKYADMDFVTGSSERDGYETSDADGKKSAWSKFFDNV